MSIDLPDNELIERYLLGKLDKAELEAFNERLKNDRELARKLRLIRMFPEMMTPAAKLEYDAKSTPKVEKAAPKKKFRIPLPKIGYLLWITIIIVAVGIAVFLFFNLSSYIVPSHVSLPKKPVAIPKPKTPPPPTALPKPISVPQPVEQKAVEVTRVEPTKEVIELVRPLEGTVFKRSDEVIFQWLQATDTFTRLYVYSATNDKLILWRGIRPGIREYRVTGTTFYPGTFYWFVGRNDTRGTFSVKP